MVVNQTNQTIPENNTISFIAPTDEVDVIYPNKGNLTLYVIDVNEGSAILAVTPDEKTILIDSSTEGESVKIIRFLKNIGYNQLDVIIASSPKPEYLGGFPLLFQKLRPPKVIYSGYPVNNSLFTSYFGGERVNLATDSIIDVGDYVVVKILVPYDKNGFSDVIEENTLVTKITFGSKSFTIFSSCNDDCQTNVDDGLSTTDVLFLANKGSCDDNSLYLLSSGQELAIMPEKLNVCTEVVNRLESMDIPLKTLSSQGTMIITTDGNTIYYKHKKSTT